MIDSERKVVESHPSVEMVEIPINKKTHIPGELGIWIFILGDVVVFGLFFTTFLFYRGQNISLYFESQEALNQNIGIINTLLLLTSSWFVVTGVRMARQDVSRAGIWIALAFLCGLGFVLNKFLEYKEKLQAGATLLTNDFYMYYYMLTGIHLMHVIFGMGILFFMWRLTRLKSLGSQHIAFLEVGASFWHLVDVLWIIMFPLLYLMR